MVDAGRITAVFRYPVKSMAGERLAAADISERGLHADRTWAVRDRERDFTTSAKRLPGLMLCTARYTAPPGPDAGPGRAPEVIIGLPSGQQISSSDPSVHTVLSEYLDTDVELRALPPVDERHRYRTPMATRTDLRGIFGLGPDDPLPDLSMFPVRKLAEISRYATPVGSYVDAYPIHLITEQSLRTMSALAPHSDFDVRRFRPTILIDTGEVDGLPELGWCGGTLRGPGAVLSPMIPTVRCVMPSHPQLELPRDPEITRTVAAHARRCLGVYATAPAAGRIAEGDLLRLDMPNRSAVAAATASVLKRALMRVVSATLPRGKD